jgi:hypothetical protein
MAEAIEPQAQAVKIQINDRRGVEREHLAEE